MNLWAVVAIVFMGVASVTGAVTYYEAKLTARYNDGKKDGERETTARMTKAIEAMQAQAADTSEKWRRTPVDEKIVELQKRCVAACEGDKTCERACVPEKKQ